MSNPTLQLIFAVCLGAALVACASQDRGLRVSALPAGDQQAFYQRRQPAVQASGPVGSVGLVLRRDKLLVLTLSLNNSGSQALLRRKIWRKS